MNMIDAMTRKIRNIQIPNRPVPQQEQQPQITQYIRPKPTANSMECPICYEKLTPDSNMIITKCKHAFCASCLLEEMNNRNTCPMCRTELKSAYDNRHQMTNIELSSIVLRNMALMPPDSFKIMDKILPLLSASAIPALFEENVDIVTELENLEKNILTSTSLFGYYLASEIRDECLQSPP